MIMRFLSWLEERRQLRRQLGILRACRGGKTHDPPPWATNQELRIAHAVRALCVEHAHRTTIAIALQQYMDATLRYAEIEQQLDHLVRTATHHPDQER